MRLAILGLAAIALSAPLQAQEITRYVERNNKPTAVTPDKRMPVSNGPNSDPVAALDSKSAYASSGGAMLTSPLVFYSIAITLASGQGPGRVMIWDATTVPPDGALSGTTLPYRCFYVDAGNRTTVFSSTSGLGFDHGFAWAFSSGANCETKTAATADQVSVSYKQ